MQPHPGTTERIISILHGLPPDKIEEVIDFAEYLKLRVQKTTKHRKPAKAGKLPQYNLGALQQDAMDRASLYGEYLATKLT